MAWALNPHARVRALSASLAAVFSVLRTWHLVGSWVPGAEAQGWGSSGLSCLPFSRSGDVVEYLLKSQWFVRCREMGDRAAQVRLHCKQGLTLGKGLRNMTAEQRGKVAQTRLACVLRRFGRSFLSSRTTSEGRCGYRTGSTM